MARGLAASVLLLAMALSLLAREAAAVNGGIGCKTFFRPDIQKAMQDQGVTDTTQIFAAMTSTSYVNWELCRACVGKRMQMKNKDVVQEGYGECWCAAGYGYSKKTTKSGAVFQKFGCSKCPKATPNSDPQTGPWDPETEKWSATKCVA